MLLGTFDWEFGGLLASTIQLTWLHTTPTQLLGAGKTTFASKEEYWAHLASVGDLPQGFKVGTSWISFTPQEANFPSRMNVTIIALDVRTYGRTGWNVVEK